MEEPYEYNSVNKAVKKLAEELEIRHASNGDLDLYILIRNYLNKPDVRKKINKVLEDNSCF